MLTAHHLLVVSRLLRQVVKQHTVFSTLHRTTLTEMTRLLVFNSSTREKINTHPKKVIFTKYVIVFFKDL